MRCLGRRRCQTEPPSPHHRSQIILHVNCICDLDMLPLFLKLGLCVCLFLRSSFTHENCQNGEYTGALDMLPCPLCKDRPLVVPAGQEKPGSPCPGCVRHSGKRGSRKNARRGERCSWGSVCVWRDTRGPDSSALPPSSAAWAQSALPARGPPCLERSSPPLPVPRGRRGCLAQLMGAGNAHTQVTSRGGLSETLWGTVVPCAQAACCQSDRLSA